MADTRPNQLLLSRDHSLHIGTLPDTSYHSHGAVALLVSLAGCLKIELTKENSFYCRSVLIDAGVNHRLVTHNEPVAVCYLESHGELSRSIRQHFFCSESIVLDPVPRSLSTHRILKYMGAGEIGRVLNLSLEKKFDQADLRVVDYLKNLRNMGDPRLLGLKENSGLSEPFGGLSESRFRHVFLYQVGVSLQHHRQWSQVVNMMRYLSLSQSVTSQALDAGFYDSAHFSRTFRKLLGLSPTMVIKNLREVKVLD